MAIVRFKCHSEATRTSVPGSMSQEVKFDDELPQLPSMKNDRQTRMALARLLQQSSLHDILIQKLAEPISDIVPALRIRS